VEELAGLSIVGTPPPTEGSPAPTCPISTLPSEVLVEILFAIATTDVAAFVRLAQVCKLFNFLVSTEDSIWKQICSNKEFGFAGMHYNFACSLEGDPYHYLEPPPRPSITPSVSWKRTFQNQPRIRYTGVYISTVNYTRPGASSASQVSWNTPVHIVTYYRYLRFFRDGTCVSLLTTTEPSEVVHHLTKENTTNIKIESDSRTEARATYHHPITKSALRGRWFLSDPNSGAGPGELHIETEGVDAKYMYSMRLALRSIRNPLGDKGPKNTKLVWKGFWSYNRLTDDWAEFGLRNDRAFFFSTVKSYGMGQ
jgi:F-box protein 9